MYQPCEWRKDFSPAVNAPVALIRIQGELAIKALKLSSIQQLSQNCSWCFGLKVKGKPKAQPDIIVCMDGNFQHQHHKLASAKWCENPLQPSLFMHKDEVDQWDNKNPQDTDELVVSLMLDEITNKTDCLL